MLGFYLIFWEWEFMALKWHVITSRKRGHAFPLLKPFSWLLVAEIQSPSLPTGPAVIRPPHCLSHDFTLQAPARPSAFPARDFPSALAAACSAPSPDTQCTCHLERLPWALNTRHPFAITNLCFIFLLSVVTDSLVYSLVCSLLLPLECELQWSGNLSLSSYATPGPGMSSVFNTCVLQCLVSHEANHWFYLILSQHIYSSASVNSQLSRPRCLKPVLTAGERDKTLNYHCLLRKGGLNLDSVQKQGSMISIAVSCVLA